MADAAATALGNPLVTVKDLEGVTGSSVRHGLALRARGLVQLGGLVGLVGDLELIALE